MIDREEFFKDEIDSRSWAPERPRQPKEFLYSIYCPRDIRYGFSLTKWLMENIGVADQNWAYNWMTSKLYFETEEDKVKFILRWL